MKTAEFLNTKANYMLQVLPEHAGDDPESGLVGVPEGAEKATLCNGYLIFWKGSKYSFSIKEGNKWCYKRSDDSIYFDFNEYMRTYGDAEIVWQRNTLQQKVDEVRQHLGITNNNTLSVMIGREKSYLRKLLKRKASSATIEKVIAELDALIVVRPTIDITSDGEIDAGNFQTIGTASGGAVEDNITITLGKPLDELKQDYINELKNEIKQANDIAECWRVKHRKLQSQFNWVVVSVISIAFSWAILAYKLWSIT